MELRRLPVSAIVRVCGMMSAGARRWMVRDLSARAGAPVDHGCAHVSETENSEDVSILRVSRECKKE